MRDMVLILNFDPAGSRAVARTLRAEHVYCKIVPSQPKRCGSRPLWGWSWPGA